MEDFNVTLNSGDFTGVEITYVYFNSEDRALVFDKRGNPYSYDLGTGTSQPLVGTGYVRLTGPTEIRVDRGTGRVYRQ